MNKAYFRGSHAAVIVYDYTNRESFERVKFWVNQLGEYEKDINRSAEINE